MIHFAESEEYLQYLQSNDLSNVIVSPVTFNSGMDGLQHDDFGRRIVFAAARAMGLISISWTDFFERFSSERLSAYAAIKMLWRVFGEDRPVLLLVDELSKAIGYDKAVMSDIGRILGEFGNVDVLTSSLSPAYINGLVTGSQRPIVYRILPPLIDFNLGQNECKLWARMIIAKAEVANGEKVEVFKVNILNNFYKLMSGHPRSILRWQSG